MRTPKDFLLTRAYNNALAYPILREGKPYRTTTPACAFADGVRDVRSPASASGTIGGAIFLAGREWAKRQEKV